MFISILCFFLDNHPLVAQILIVTKSNKEFVFPVITTTRLTLKEFKEQDAEALMHYYGDEETMVHYDLDPFPHRNEALSWVNKYKEMYYKNDGIRWAITLNETGEVIGDIGFNGFFKWNLSTDVGYILRKDHWRKGLISEALKAVLHWVFSEFDTMKINRIEAETSLGNEASIKTLEKFGFKEEGILREARMWRGKLTTIRLFSLLRSDYEHCLNR